MPRRRRHQQLALSPRRPHPEHPGWGGSREGSGRKSKGRVQHRARPRHNPRHPVHVTLRLLRGLPGLRNKACIKILRKAFKDSAKQDFRLVHFSVQRDHLHLIVEAQNRKALSRGMRGLLIRVAKRLNALFGRRGQVFAERYHTHVLKTPSETRFSVAYVLLNGRKHEAQKGRRYAFDLVDYYSSGIHFDGWDGPVRLSAPHPDAIVPVDAPRCWLLQEGWRRKKGLLSPGAVPGEPPQSR